MCFVYAMWPYFSKPPMEVARMSEIDDKEAVHMMVALHARQNGRGTTVRLKPQFVFTKNRKLRNKEKCVRTQTNGGRKIAH